MLLEVGFDVRLGSYSRSRLANGHVEIPCKIDQAREDKFQYPGGKRHSKD